MAITRCDSPRMASVRVRRRWLATSKPFDRRYSRTPGATTCGKSTVPAEDTWMSARSCRAWRRPRSAVRLRKMLPVQTNSTCFIAAVSADRYPLAQGDELFGRRRMDSDRRVELRLGGAELHGDGDSLDHLTGVGADHMRADHLLAGAVDHELHEGALGLVAHRELQRPERSLVHVDRAELRARMLFGQADRGDVRVGEDRRGHGFVVNRGGLVAEERSCEPHGFGGRHRREVEAVGEIAD